MSKRKTERMMTEAKVLTMIQQIMEMWRKSRGPCECTIHKRTGDIADLCSPCSMDCALVEVFDYLAEQYEGEKEG